MTALKKYFALFILLGPILLLSELHFFLLFSFCPKLLDIVNVVTVNSHFNQSGDCGHWVLSCMRLFLISLAGLNKAEEFYISHYLKPF